MKKYLSLIFVLLMSNVFGQVSQDKKRKEHRDDFTISLSEADKSKIDWNLFENLFEGRNIKDSIQFSVILIQPKVKNLDSEKKYTVRGRVEDFDELLGVMKKLINN